ncbi:hypothetical protein A7X81_03625 [Campylobacter ornithocola]|uniref:Uncharacterized protein n=1 Tax=Campylobacter ornithocola TaxID=1848766 RepID=A0A6M8N5B7_9BACT|nr:MULTISPECIES: hypothetical protein [Campylobacter]MBT0824023.1 hypothetical protein [Campylobacter lari]OCX42291.1 hypothetical protein A7X81_03625 [Campylobacter ornithocola]QKF57183.1 hypothetical protein CORN_0653 [Campylobacter ornithocola]
MKILLDLNFDIQQTKGGKRLVDFIDKKYQECFAMAKNQQQTPEYRLKALEQMAFLDTIINLLKEEDDE